MERSIITIRKNQKKNNHILAMQIGLIPTLLKYNIGRKKKTQTTEKKNRFINVLQTLVKLMRPAFWLPNRGCSGNF